MKLNVGIVGGGAVAQAHLAAFSIQDNVAIQWLSDVSEQTLEKSCSRFQIRNTTTDYRRLLDDPAVNVVDVCQPPHLHRKVGTEALIAGKDAIIEKPIALTLEEADSLIDRTFQEEAFCRPESALSAGLHRDKASTAERGNWTRFSGRHHLYRG